MSLGPAEILVVLVLALVVFGPKRLPEVGRQVGGALRELRKVQDTVQSEIRSVMDETVGPIHGMSSYEPVPHEPTPRELAAPDATSVESHPREPDLGDEHQQPVDDEPERPGIDGLSGGTFS